MKKLTIDEIKNNVNMVEYLSHQGIPMKREGGNIFISLRDEKEASVVIRQNKEGRFLFHDFGSSNSGSIIDLVQNLNNCNFTEAVNHLREYLGDNSYQHAKKNEIKVKKISEPIPKIPKEGISKEVKSIENISHLNPQILEDKNKIIALEKHAYFRGINRETLKNSIVKFLKDEKGFYYLGLENEKNGLALRNSLGKFNVGKIGISQDITNPNNPTLIVEGLFDYLSAKEITGKDYNYIVLNSTVNKNAAISLIQDKKLDNIVLLLDNDNSGQTISKHIENKLLKEKIEVVNLSPKVFSKKFNDINDFYVSSKKNKDKYIDALKTKLYQYKKINITQPVQILNQPAEGKKIDNIILFDNKTNFEAFSSVYKESLKTNLILYLKENTQPAELKEVFSKINKENILNNKPKLYTCFINRTEIKTENFFKEVGVKSFTPIKGVASDDFTNEMKENFYNKILSESLINNTSFLKY